MIMLKLQNLVPGRQNREQSGLASPGFTLIELLAVIAVLVLLLAMLMPSLRGAKEIARQMQCLSNLRQLGVLASLYSNDYNNFVVPSNISTGYLSVFDGLDGNGHYDSWVADKRPNGKPVHGGEANGNGITVWDQLLKYLGAPDPMDYASATLQDHCRRTGKHKAIQCPSGPWGGGTLQPVAGVYPYNFVPPPYPNMTTESGDQSGHGHYRINIHVDNGAREVWAGASYNLYHEVPADKVNWYNGPNPDSHNSAIASYWPRGLRTAQWEDSSGTIFMFEAWQPYTWGHCGGAGMAGPMIAYRSAWIWGYPDDADGRQWNAAVKLWQEKHLDKASVLFCDGHTQAVKMIDTVGPVKTNLHYRNYAGFTKVTGMWTRYLGD